MAASAVPQLIWQFTTFTAEIFHCQDNAVAARARLFSPVDVTFFLDTFCKRAFRTRYVHIYIPILYIGTPTAKQVFITLLSLSSFSFKMASEL